MKGCRSLSDQEIEDVLITLGSIRDRLLFLLGLKSGLRISELLSISIKDILQHGEVANWVTIAKKNTKGKIESKTLPLTERVRSLAKDYLDTIPNRDSNLPLFKSTKSNRAISRMQAHRILKDAYNHLKLEGKVATHSMRKSYAHRIHLALGEKIEKTQKAMGHRSITSTVSYLQVDQEEITKAILGAG